MKGSGSYERATDYVFDGRGLVRSEKQYPAWPSTAGPLVSTNTYDAAANPLTAVDPLGQTTTFGFDALNRLSSIDYSDAATSDVAYGYDAHGNRTSMNDGTGASSYGYDETDRLVSVSTPGPKTVGYRYDLDGNRAKLIYPDATTVAYSYDKASRMTSLLDWASRSVSYTYWPDSLLKTATNPDASVATYTYDNSRRLIDIYHARLGTTIERSSYGLDPVGNVTGLSSGSLTNQLGRPDGVVSSGGTWTGTYSDINEITPNDATFLASPASPTTSHFYEASITDIAPPFVTTGTTFRYRYAKDGNNSGKTTNLIVELRQGTTVIASQTHNNIPGVDGSGWQQAGLTLNAAQAAMVTNVTDLRLRFRPSSSGGGQGRKAQVSWAEIQLPGPGDPSTLFSYGYDRLSRITSAAGPDGPRSYAYDPVGNRLGKVVGASTAYTYDRADRLLTVGGSSVTVDANGNLTARGSDAFGFDQANRLSNATVGGTTETYVYDGDGVRFSRQAGASPAVRYVSDVARILPTTIDDGTRKYVYGLGLAYAVSGSTIEVFHADRLGSVRAVTNASGTVTATGRFDEWGVQTQSSGGSGQPFSFTGEPRDPTGLTYLRSRYYDPSLGRFISRDTWSGDAARPQSQNRFAYPNNNPTTLTDPSGHCGVDLVADLLFTGYDLIALVTGPEKDRGFNTAMLAADGLLLFVPCATGGGMLLRAGDEAAGLLDDAAQGAAESCLLRSFTGDTLVATPDGHVPISTIEVGDIVLAWDEATGEVVERSVIAVLPHPDDEIAKVTIDGMVLNTTPDHVFYALEDGWVEVGRLTSGARVKALSGSGHLQHVAVEPYAGTLWDLTVAGAHNFFVGKGQWLVHNMCPMPGIPDWVRSAGGTVSWAKNFEKAYKASGEIPSVAQVDQLVETARTHGVDVIRLDPPHPGTPWDVPHLKIGDAHVPVPEGYQLK